MNSDLKQAIFLATLLDNQFRIGTVRFGIDAIIDLLPFAGDTVILVLSLYIVLLAARLRVPPVALGRMLGNIAFSYCIGIIPFIGDIAYFTLRPNIRNLAILREHVPDIRLAAKT